MSGCFVERGPLVSQRVLRGGQLLLFGLNIRPRFAQLFLVVLQRQAIQVQRLALRLERLPQPIESCKINGDRALLFVVLCTHLRERRVGCRMRLALGLEGRLL